MSAFTVVPLTVTETEVPLKVVLLKGVGETTKLGGPGRFP